MVLRQRNPGESARVALKSDDFAQVVLGRRNTAELAKRHGRGLAASLKAGQQEHFLSPLPKM